MKLTEEDIKHVIVRKEYTRIGEKTTICLLTLENGFEVIGTSACVNPEDFDYETGKKFALERAMDKVWELEGYRLQWRLYGEQREVEQHELDQRSDSFYE